ncbi:MAG: ABC transporter permease [Myxococcales bacterium]|nr:ABC transporter permease [Myxococcales bacterium]MCB9534387.1 ABC transporter permease [Myxococcales bacterium]
MGYARFIGLRHLTSRRHRFLNTLTLLAVAGVALGVAAFTTVVSVAGGFVTSFQERLLGLNPHIVVTKYGVYFSDYAAAEDAIARVEGVEATAPFMLREMLVTRAGSRARPGVVVKGVDVDVLLTTPGLPDLVAEGDLAALETAGDIETDATPEAPQAPVAIGRVLARTLGAELGDTLTLVSPLRGLRAAGVDAGGGANYARVRIVAILDTGYYESDSGILLMDYRGVQQLLGMGDVVMGIEVRTHDPNDTERIAGLIEGVLTTGRFVSLDWRELNRNTYRALRLQKLALSVVMSILVVVACLVILCVLVMLVLEKRREIAILRSMGATAGGVLRVFVFEGMAIGALGTALGLVGGAVLCAIIARIDFPLAYEVYRVRSLPVDAQPLEFAGAAAVSLFVCLLATLYPAWRATQVSPADALRYD